MIRERRERQFEEAVLEISRISRTVAGGRRIRFRVLVALGDYKGKVGIGVGKAPDIAEAIRKAKLVAEKHMIEVPVHSETIPCKIIATYGASKLILKPASQGRSIIAGGSVRTIVSLAGIKNISIKILGSDNKINNAKAMMIALKKIKKLDEQLKFRRRSKESQMEKKNGIDKNKK